MATYPLDTRHMVVRIVGDSPLVIHPSSWLQRQRLVRRWENGREVFVADWKYVVIRIVGRSPLITHNWSARERRLLGIRPETPLSRRFEPRYGMDLFVKSKEVDETH